MAFEIRRIVVRDQAKLPPFVPDPPTPEQEKADPKAYKAWLEKYHKSMVVPLQQQFREIQQALSAIGSQFGDVNQVITNQEDGAITQEVVDNTIDTAITDLNLGTASTRPIEDFATAGHGHGNITNGGAIGTAANRPIITGTSGILQAGTFGSTSNTFCEGNDARLSDARVPLPHAASHADGGSDSIQPFAGVQFNTTTPDPTPSIGQMVWNDTDGTVDMLLKGGNVNMQIGQSSIHRVLNDSGAPIPKGKVVYIFGAQGQRLSIRLADNDTDTTSARTFGFTAEAIANNAQGFVISEGVLNNVSTSGLADGTILWLGDDGNYVGTRPTQPEHGVFLGVVVKGNSVGAGSIFVKIQNGQELEELHDVLITTPSAGQVLARNTGNTLWVNKTLTPSDIGAANAVHTHAAGDITSGVFNNSLINFASPDAIGSTLANTGAFTTLSFSTQLNGPVGANVGSVSAPAITLGASNTGFYISSNQIACVKQGVIGWYLDNTSRFWVASTNGLSIGNTGSPLIFSRNISLYPDANGELHQRSTTQAQAYMLYNTYTSGTNFERANLRWSSNVFQIGTEKGSAGGSARNIEFYIDNNFRARIQNEGVVLSTNASRVYFGNPLISGDGESNTSLDLQPFGSGNVIIRSGLLKMNGTSASFPALKRSSTTLQVRLADDTGFAPLECGTLTTNGNVTLNSGNNIVLSATTGTQIGTATTQLLSFYGVTPVDQPATVTDAATQDLTGSDTVDKTKLEADLTSCKNAINAIIDRLQELGLIA